MPPPPRRFRRRLLAVMLVTGAWTELMGWLRSWLAATGFGESAL